VATPLSWDCTANGTRIFPANVSGFAADAYSRLNGIGLVCVTYCVGGLNVLNAIAGAYAEKSPVVVVSGGPGVKDREKDPLLHHKVKTFETQKRVYDEVTVASTILLDEQTGAPHVVRRGDEENGSRAELLDDPANFLCVLNSSS